MNKIYPIRLFLKNLPISIMLVASFLFSLSSWIWILWNIRPQEENIFLHYNILFGVDMIGEWYKVLYLPLTGSIIFLVNSLLSWILFPKDKFASQLLLAVSTFCQIFVLIASSILVFLNV